MGLLDKVISRYVEKSLNKYYITPNNRSPTFYRESTEIYDDETARSCIHAIASHCSKLTPTITGIAYKELKNILAYQPNEWQTTSQFLYRIATILEVNNTAYLLPVYDEKTGWLCGYYPALPDRTVIMQDENNEPWLEYKFASGEKAAIELKYAGVLTKHQYKNDIIGEKNDALDTTLQVISVQNEGIMAGVENASNFQFYARSENFSTSKDLQKETANFTRQNFGADNKSAVLLFPNTYADIKQAQPTNNIVNPKQQEIVKTSMYNYYGVNEAIVQNKANGDEWSAFYEGKIEPFANQLSQVMTNMTYSRREIAFGNSIVWHGSKLQTMSNRDKLDYCINMYDRGLANHNMCNEVWGLAPVPGGEKFYIRKEYIEVSQLDANNSIIISQKEDTHAE